MTHLIAERGVLTPLRRMTLQKPANRLTDALQAHLIVRYLLENPELKVETKIHLKSLQFTLEDEIGELGPRVAPL
jgi:hypothetical protein